MFFYIFSGKNKITKNQLSVYLLFFKTVFCFKKIRKILKKNFKKGLFNSCFENFPVFKNCFQKQKNISVDPAFLAIMRFPLKKARLVFFYFKQKKPFLENGLESPLIFVFILKGKTK